MKQVFKEEAEQLRELFPDVSITITNRQTSHKKYYVAEEQRILRAIEEMRKANVKESVR